MKKLIKFVVFSMQGAVDSLQYAGVLLNLKYAVGSFSTFVFKISSVQYAGALLRSKYAVCSTHCCEKKSKFNLKNGTTDLTSLSSKLLNCRLVSGMQYAVGSTHRYEKKPNFNIKNGTTYLISFTAKLLNCLPHTANIRNTEQLPTANLPTANIRNTEQLPTIFTKMLNCLLHTANLPTAKLPTTNIRIVKQLLTAYCILITAIATAQLHPVQVNQNIIPPYNTKLNSYATTSAVKLRLYLTMTDVNISNRQIRLKLKIEGQGLNVQSVNFVQGAPLVFLNGGTTQQFTNIDLAPYFQLHNLTGISPQQYNRSLPDGRYKICWEVYDFLTGQRISNPQMGGCSSIFLLLNDPPFLNIPNRGDQLTNIQPTNIIFQWTPRHANASGVSYEFELRELWDTQIDPQAGFLASPPYHSETTYSTTLLYNISKPPLMPGRTYAWRVRAKSTTGLSENSVFKNNGYSEIFYFTFTDQCYPPTMTLAEPLNTGRVKINWKTHPDHNRYHVQYKRADVSDAEWFEIFSYNNQAQISNLQEGVTYDFRVGGTCHALTDLKQGFTYSSVNQFTMPTKDETVSYSCGIIPEIEITNTNPLANIGVNETFTAGDFPVTVKQKQGGNGTFSGTGYIVVPYLADTKIAVEFNRIKINTDYQLYEGVIKTTYDPTWSSVESTGDLFNGGDGQVNTSEVNFQIAEILVAPDGDILIVGKGGTPIVELSGGEDYVITDSGDPEADPPVLPKKYHVDEQGNVTELGTQAEGGTTTTENTTGVNSKGEATSITAQGVTVTFSQLPTASLPTANLPTGFDAYNPSQPQTKDLYKKLGSDYYMPYKAVAKGKIDFIVANFSITNDSIQPKDIIFKTKDGVALEKVASTPTSFTLKLKGTLSDADIETQALVKQDDKYQIAGAFMQYQIAIKEVDVVLVNTSNSNTTAIAEKLKAIYQQAAVSINVSVMNDFTTTLNSLTPDGTIQSGESGFAVQYTEQQRSINNALKEHGNYKPNAYYLILTDKQPVDANGSSNTESGLMPLGRQFGYIYTDNCSTANCQLRTAAHELAHGAFQLKHPFSTHSYKYAKGSTNWLLDYNNGEHLPYVHWKAIHNPNLRIGIFDGDSEGESTALFVNILDSDIEDDINEIIEFSSACSTNKIRFKYNAIANLSSQELQLIIEGGSFTKDGRLKSVMFNGRTYKKSIVYNVIPVENSDLPEIGNPKLSARLINKETTESDAGKVKGLKWITYKDKNGEVQRKVSIAKGIGLPYVLMELSNIETCEENVGELWFMMKNKQQNCFVLEEKHCSKGNGTSSGISSLKSQLKRLVQDSREGTGIEFEQNGQIYGLTSSGELLKVKDTLSKEDINNGIWKDSDELKVRYVNNDDGYLQLEAFGFSEELQTKIGTKEDVKSINKALLSETNRFFKEHQVKSAFETPRSKGINLNNANEVFPDGDAMVLDNDASFVQITSEGINVVKTLLKTALVEENVYLDKPPTNVVFHAPGLVTGTVEASATVVTDVTSMCTMVYSFSTDKQVRTQAYEGFVKLKNQIKDDGATVIPLFVEAITCAASGNTTEEWKQINDPNTDKGKKGHLASRGTVQTVKTVLVSGAILTKLPKLADDIIAKLKKIDFTSINKRISDLDLEKLSKLEGLDDLLKKKLKYVAQDLSDAELFEFEDRFEELIEKFKEIQNLPADKAKSALPEWLRNIRRGNDFNAKRKFDYPYNEIWLTHPTKKYPVGHKSAGKPRRYRLDSWNPDTGKIVSRKATTLSEIKASTFESYLKELKNKYPKESKIANSSIGDKLSGKCYLEIPESNRTFFEASEKLKKLAEDNKVEVIFKAE